jgi:hypothetical protein
MCTRKENICPTSLDYYNSMDHHVLTDGNDLLLGRISAVLSSAEVANSPMGASHLFLIGFPYTGSQLLLTPHNPYAALTGYSKNYIAYSLLTDKQQVKDMTTSHSGKKWPRSDLIQTTNYVVRRATFRHLVLVRNP